MTGPAGARRLADVLATRGGAFDVASHAEAIVQRLSDGTMPCDGAWPAERIAAFRRWIETDKHATTAAHD
jgi:hypothetical protein